MRDVPPDALLRAPERKWNSLQIIEHLFLSYTATTKGLLHNMAEGQPPQGAQDNFQPESSPPNRRHREAVSGKNLCDTSTTRWWRWTPR